MTAANTDRTVTDRDETAEVAKYRYHYTRVVETAGRVVRVRIERGSRPSQCHAVAEVLADTMTWTHLTHEVPTHWIDDTPPPSLIIHAATELGPVADRLVHRAADILAPPTTSSPPEVSETMVRRFTENGCEVTAVVADPPSLHDDARSTRCMAQSPVTGCSSVATTAQTASVKPTGASSPSRATTCPSTAPDEPGLRKCRHRRADHRTQSARDRPAPLATV